jgi:hypothetical protein
MAMLLERGIYPIAISGADLREAALRGFFLSAKFLESIP